MVQNINGQQLWVQQLHVLNLHHYHFGMPIMIIIHHLVIMQHTHLVDGVHHQLNNMLVIPLFAVLELI
jgi:hypothetical protein